MSGLCALIQFDTGFGTGFCLMSVNKWPYHAPGLSKQNNKKSFCKVSAKFLQIDAVFCAAPTPIIGGQAPGRVPHSQALRFLGILVTVHFRVGSWTLLGSHPLWAPLARSRAWGSAPGGRIPFLGRVGRFSADFGRGNPRLSDIQDSRGGKRRERN